MSEKEKTNYLPYVVPPLIGLALAFIQSKYIDEDAVRLKEQEISNDALKSVVATLEQRVAALAKELATQEGLWTREKADLVSLHTEQLLKSDIAANTKFESMKVDLENRLVSVTASKDDEISSLKSTHALLAQSIEADADSIIAALRNAHDAKISEITTTFDMARLSMEQQFTTQRNNLIAAHRLEIDSITSSAAQERNTHSNALLKAQNDANLAVEAAKLSFERDLREVRGNYELLLINERTAREELAAGFAAASREAAIAHESAINALRTDHASELNRMRLAFDDSLASRTTDLEAGLRTAKSVFTELSNKYTTLHRAYANVASGYSVAIGQVQTAIGFMFKLMTPFDVQAAIEDPILAIHAGASVDGAGVVPVKISQNQTVLVSGNYGASMNRAALDMMSLPAFDLDAVKLEGGFLTIKDVPQLAAQPVPMIYLGVPNENVAWPL